MNEINEFGNDILKNDLFNEIDFRDLHLVCQEISFKEFCNCSFEGCKFSESLFRECQFEDCNFKNCDLSLIKVSNSSLRGIEFKNSKLLGINWTDATSPLSVNFTSCVINHSVFTRLSLRKINIVDCYASDVDFAEADLTQANFKQTNLLNARFLNTNLAHADFSDANSYSVNPNLNKLKKTKFSLPEAISLLSSFDIVLQ
jgi:uncharacterized protein YjbI with pentapeptide repeats